MHRMHLKSRTLRSSLLTLSFIVVLTIDSNVLDAQESKLPVSVSYEVDLTEANTNYINVTMTAKPVGKKTEIMMATWTPGSYLVREYARHIDTISASNDDGELEITKTKKNRWVVSTPGNKPFSVKYRVFCRETSVRTNYADENYCCLNGAPTFITVPEYMEKGHSVKLIMPKAWKKSASSMPLIGGEDDHHYMAADYDELVDSPIVAGLVEVFPFEVADVPHFLVNVNDQGNWDGEKAAKDLVKVVEAHHEMWGVIPYDRYFFINVICDSGGGLEHDHCCLMMSGQRSMRNEGSYLGWLSLCSHEFFHTWNVRRLRPKSLVDYDYEAEVYTPSLWVAEGVTSYYEDLLLVRAGLMEADDFLKNTSNLIRREQNLEGRKVQSLRESSFDAWIKFYRPSPNSRDTQVSYYSKGSLAAFLLDIEIRNATNGEKSLDDAMRMLYQKNSKDGYLPKDFRKICSTIAGKDMNKWFESAIDSTDELEYQNLADYLGVTVGPLYPTAANKDAEEPKQRPWIGIGEEDSPADEAGLREDDEVLAINGKRLTDELKDQVRKAKVGDEWKLLINRENEIEELTLTIGGQDVPVRWNMEPWDDASITQRLNRHNWLQGASDGPEIFDPPKPAPPIVYKWTKKKLMPIQ